MGRVSSLLTGACVLAFASYLVYTLYVFHSILVTPGVPPGVKAWVPAMGWSEEHALQLHVFVSTDRGLSWGREGVSRKKETLRSPLLANWSSEPIPFFEAADKEAIKEAGAGVISFPVPEGVYGVDSDYGKDLYAHVYLTRWGQRPEADVVVVGDDGVEETVVNPAWDRRTTLYREARLSQRRAPPPATRRLLTTNATQAGLEAEVQKQRRVTYLWPKLTLELVHDFTRFNVSTGLPFRGENARVHKLSRGNPDRDGEGEYEPVFRVGTFGQRTDSLLGPLNSTYMGGCDEEGRVWVFVEVEVEPIRLSWFKFTEVMEESFKMQRDKLGGEEKEAEDLKRMMTDTNPVLLLVSFVVAVLHLLFDVLSFKNDIAFWRKQESLEGLSGRAVIITALSRVVIYTYLAHEGANILVRFSLVTAFLVDLWKIVGIIFPNMRRIAKAKLKPAAEAEVAKDGNERGAEPSALATLTEEIDAFAFKWLSLILVPGVLAYFAYLLVAHEYTTWFSWFLKCVTALTYTFGFIAMTPQLFMNYRLKSVESMPWRALTYKALNTFIDDLFAFIIAMPTMHRLGCFRDDIVFFIFLYQRWIYPKRKDEDAADGDQDTVKGGKKAKGKATDKANGTATDKAKGKATDKAKTE